MIKIEKGKHFRSEKLRVCFTFGIREGQTLTFVGWTEHIPELETTLILKVDGKNVGIPMVNILTQEVL